MSIPTTWKEWVSLAIAVIVLAGFIWVFGEAFYESFQKNGADEASVAESGKATEPAKNESAPPPADLATILAGLVTTVVATVLGVPPPAGTSRMARMGAVAARFSPGDWRPLIALAYLVVYIGVGIVAVICWRKAPSPPQEVYSLAWTFIGFATAVVKSQF